MSDNQKFIIFAIVICTVLAFVVNLVGQKMKDEVNYDYYVVTDTNENNYNTLDGYKLSSNISSKVINPYAKLELSAILDYNLNVKTNNDYPGDVFTNLELTNDYYIITAINTLYKSDLLISTTEEEKEKYNADYKVASISVDRLINIIFGNVSYDKKIETNEIKYNADNDLYYFSENKNKNKNNYRLETKIIDVKEQEQNLDIKVAVAYLNYTNNKVYKEASNTTTIMKKIDNEELFNNLDAYKQYNIRLVKDENSQYRLTSIELCE